MELSVLGCAGSFPGPDSPCSAYLLEAEGFRLLIDFGTGALSALQRHPAGMHGVDAILLSHLHCDHILDACSYVVVRRYDPAGKHRPMPLYGPAGTAERLLMIDGPGDGLPYVDDVYDVNVLRPGKLSIGPFQVTLARVNHPGEAFGMRIENNGHVLAYSGDSGKSDALVELAQGADLFLCEASYLESKPHPSDIHLTAREAGEYASIAKVQRLVLTHLVKAWNDPADTFAEARAAFRGSIQVASPGAVYSLH
jgi:ribonuclease BN (tRNA processing enzyme)